MKEFLDFKKEIKDMDLETLLDMVATYGNTSGGMNSTYVDIYRKKVFLLKLEIMERFNSKNDV